jgi:superoxide dismutase, Fe-Mn family
MDSPLQSRRQVFAAITAATIAGTASAATVSSPVAPPATATPPAFRGQHIPKPLSFDPAKLNGLSEKLLVSHHESELMYRNSMTLHEAYFDNLGGDGNAAGAIASALAGAYGSFDAWQLHFRGTGASLAGGSGWVVLWHELMTGELRTVGSNHHTLSLATSLPLLVMDMYEHAYAIDFGAAAARYIDSFFANVQWNAVNQRLEQADRVTRSLRG